MTFLFKKNLNCLYVDWWAECFAFIKHCFTYRLGYKRKRHRYVHWQYSPILPFIHLHVYSLPFGSQVPPFIHGEYLQGAGNSSITE